MEDREPSLFGDGSQLEDRWLDLKKLRLTPRLVTRLELEAQLAEDPHLERPPISRWVDPRAERIEHGVALLQEGARVLLEERELQRLKLRSELMHEVPLGSSEPERDALGPVLISVRLVVHAAPEPRLHRRVIGGVELMREGPLLRRLVSGLRIGRAVQLLKLNR